MEARTDSSTALSLMRMALALLDRAGNTVVAANLQHAIDIGTDAPVPRSVEEMDAFCETDEGRRLLSRLGFDA